MADPTPRLPIPRTMGCLPAVCLIGALLSGCTTAGHTPGREMADPAPIPTPDRAIVLDGRFEDWPEGVAATADARYVYVRFRPHGDAELRTLQSSDRTVSLLLDLDGNPRTGLAVETGSPGVELGAELRVEMSPRRRGEPATGVTLTGYSQGGQPTPIGHSDADFMFTPTYASGWYEARVSRSVLVGESVASEPDAGPDPGLLTDPDDPAAHPLLAEIGSDARWRLGSGTGRGIIQVTGPGGEPGKSSGVFEFSMPPGTRDPVAFEIEPMAARATRIVSWNVLRSAPMRDPNPFARVLSALAPDVVLVQEWDGVDAEELAGWFEQHLGGRWHAVAKPEHGVGIVSRGEIIVSDTGDYVPLTGSEHPVRYVGAVVRTGWRDTAVASVHLKCCGSAGSDEDRRRLSEASLIADLFEGLASDPEMPRLIAGDINLVGSRRPLDELRSGLDADGSSLEVAETMVLGDAAIYTWRNPRSAFTPGRLDFAVYSDANARVIRAFALDTDRLGADTLAAWGLEPGDTDASDHLPMVVDLRPLGVVAPGR